MFMWTEVTEYVRNAITKSKYLFYHLIDLRLMPISDVKGRVRYVQRSL